MKIKIKVTKDILKKSMMCGTKDFEGTISTNCAIALAIRDIFSRASVGVNHFSVLSKNGMVQIELPEKARKFISSFDGLFITPQARLDLPEMSFEVDVPSELINQIGISQVYKVLSESKTLELVEI